MKIIIEHSTNVMGNFKKKNILGKNHQAILKTLVYSDVFDYPLTIDELYHFIMDVKVSKKEFKNFLGR